MMGKLKRCLAGFLAVAMVLSSSSISYAAEAIEAKTETWSSNAASVVADAYDLTNEEKSLLSSGHINSGEKYEVKVPNDTKLVKIDSLQKTVTAYSFQAGSRTWLPLKAEVKVEGEIKDTVTFEEEGEKYVSTAFSCEGSYSVDVIYGLSIEIAAEEQQRILSIPAILVEAMEVTEELDTAGSYLGILGEGTTLADLNAKAQEYKKQVDALDKMGQISKEKKEEAYKLINAVGALYKDHQDGGINLANLSEESKKADSKLVYLMNNASSVQKKAEDLFNTLYTIYTNEFSSQVAGAAVLDNLGELVGEDGCVTALKSLDESTCRLLNEKTQQAVFGEVGYPGDSSFEELISNISCTKVDDLKDTTILAATTVISAQVNAVEVTVVVQATAAADGVDDLECKNLESFSEKIVLPVDITAADIAEKITSVEEGLTTQAKGKWKQAGYDVTDETVYEKPEKSEMPESLTEGKSETYTVSYAPKMHTVKTDYMGEKSVAHGTKIRLPYNGKKGTYFDYTVTADTSEYYNEGAVLAVTCDLEIARAEVERTVGRLLEKLSNNHTYPEAVATVILPGKAVNSPLVSVKYPTAGMVGEIVYDSDEKQFYTTAKVVDSGIEGMSWVPVSAVLMNGNQELTDWTVDVQDAVTFEVESRDKTFFWAAKEQTFTHIKIKYELVITRVIKDNKYTDLTNEDLLYYLNLPKKLTDEVKAQDSILNGKVTKVYKYIMDDENMQRVMNTAVLSLLRDQLSSESQKAIDEILKREGNNEKLTLFTVMDTCCEIENGTAKGNLVTYLQNDYHKIIREEAGFLAPHLRTIADDAKLGDALKSFGVTVDNVDDLRKKIKDFTEDLDGEGGLCSEIKDLSEDFIREDAAAFASLIEGIKTEIIDKNVQVPEFTEADRAVDVWYDTADAPGLGSVNISVTGPTGVTKNDKYTFEATGAENYTLNAQDAERIKEIYQNLKNDAGITSVNEKYYNELASEALPTEGSVVAITSNYTFKYEAKTYKEDILSKGNTVDQVTFTGTDKQAATFVLKALDDDVCEYRYIVKEVVDGKEVVTTIKVAKGEKITYTVKNLASLAEGQDTLSIERETINKKTDSIDAIVKALNDAIAAEEGLKINGELAVAFVPVKDFSGDAANGEYRSLVLRLNGAEQINFDSLMPAFASAMVEIAPTTGYIGFGEGETQSGFLYRNEENSTKINIQAFIDLLLNSDLSLDKIRNTIQSNGTTVENVGVKDGWKAESDGLYTGTNLGGKLIETRIQLGSSKENNTDIPMYITLAGNESEYLKGLKASMDSISKYASLEMAEVEGKSALSLTATMPEKAYTVYLSTMLLLGALDENEISESTLKEQVLALKEELLGDLKLSEVDYKVIENTLNSTIYKDNPVDLSKHEKLINQVIKVVDGALRKMEGEEGGNPAITEIKSEGGQYAFDMVYDLETVLNKIEGISDFTGLLSDTKINLPVSLTVANISEDVEAIVLDWGRSGISKLRYVDDVAKALEEAQGVCYVYLLKNIDSSENRNVLSVKRGTVLNLNGKTVLPGIQANAPLRIVDSQLAAGEVGKVFGNVTGSDVRIAAGQYKNQTLAPEMLREGYTQNEKGVVESEFYTVNTADGGKLDEDGNKIEVRYLDIKLSSDLVGMTEGNIQTLALDIISDVVFNIYDCASIAVDGNVLFSADAEDLLGDYDGLQSIVSKLSGCVNKSNIQDFVKKVNDKFGSIEKLADLVENGGQIADFELTTANWGVKAELKDGENGKYIGIDLATDQPQTSIVRISFMDKNPELAKTLREAAELVTFKHEFAFNKISFENGKLKFDGTVKMDIFADLTKNLENDEQKSSDYVTAIAAVLAYSLKDGDQKSALISAIVDYENNIYAQPLENAIDGITVREFIDAIKAAAEKDVTFEMILKATGLRNLLSDTMSVEAAFAPALGVAYNLVGNAEKLINKLDNKVDIYQRTLGGIKDVKEGVRTYGGTLGRGDNMEFTASMKLFSENYVPPIDQVLSLLNAIPEDLKVIYDQEYGVDFREEYLSVVSEARAAYDALSDALKKYVPADLYQRLLDAEVFYNKMGVWVASIEDQTYAGKAIKLSDEEIRVYDGSKLLKNKADYTVSYKYNTNAADKTKANAPRVIVKLRGNYSGTIYAYFTIKPVNLNSEAVTVVDVVRAESKKAYYGKPVVKFNGKTVSSSEYTLSYPDKNTEGAYAVSGSYSIVVTAKEKNFTGSITVKQNVATALMSKVSVAKIANQKFTGEEIKPALTVKYGKVVLTEGTHFTTEYKNNTEVGTAVVTLTGTGEKDSEGRSFIGSKTVTFKIVATDKFTSQMVTLLTETNDLYGNPILVPLKKGYIQKTYTGKAIELVNGTDYKVTAGLDEEGNEIVLTEGTDYTVTYSKNVNKGTVTVAFKGIGKYTGTVKKSFKIVAAPITDLLVSDPNIEVAYQKNGVKPVSEIVLKDANTWLALKYNKDYTLSWKNTTRVATWNEETDTYEYVDARKGTPLAEKYLPTVEITGKGNYSGKIKLTYVITPAKLEEQAVMTAKDVLLANKNNNYKTSFTLKDVNGKSLTSKTDYSTAYEYYVWDGDEFVAVNESGRLDSKGRISFLDGEDSILMKIKVTGVKNYAGSALETEYRIYKTSINSSKTTITFNDPNKIFYDKYEQQPEITVKYGKDTTLVKDKDYVITDASYRKNIFVGTATVTIEGIGAYGGTKSKTFRIYQFNQPAVDISKDGNMVFTYGENGQIIADYEKGGVKPSDQIVLQYVNAEAGKNVELKEGRDYKLTWYNTTRVATWNESTGEWLDVNGKPLAAKYQPKVKITGIGNFKGSVTVNYTIKK